MFKVINIMLLIFSVFLGLGLFLFKTEQKYLLSNPYVLSFKNNEFLKILLLASLYTYRYLCNIPLVLYYGYIMLNFSITLLFSVFRFYNIANYHTLTSATYISFWIVFLLSLILSVSRVLFRIGYGINKQEHILNTVLETVLKSSGQFLTNMGKRMTGHIPKNPGGAGEDRHFALGVGMLGAAVAGSLAGISMAVSSHRSAIAAERSADIAERAADISERTADISERTLDIQERNSGNITSEIYNSKWDAYGNRIKR